MREKKIRYLPIVLNRIILSGWIPIGVLVINRNSGLQRDLDLPNSNQMLHLIDREHYLSERLLQIIRFFFSFKQSTMRNV